MPNNQANQNKPISEAQRVSNREEIITLLRGTRREGIEAVIKFMKEHGFFRAAGSCVNHNNFYGGLANHSLQVYRKAKEVWGSMYANDDSFYRVVRFDSIVICSLLHDLCKHDVYRAEKNHCVSVNPKAEQKKHGLKSLEILDSLGLVISDNERLTIRWHMGDYTTDLLPGEDLSVPHILWETNPLCRIIIEADSLAAKEAMM